MSAIEELKQLLQQAKNHPKQVDEPVVEEEAVVEEEVKPSAIEELKRLLQDAKNHPKQVEKEVVQEEKVLNEKELKAINDLKLFLNQIQNAKTKLEEKTEEFNELDPIPDTIIEEDAELVSMVEDYLKSPEPTQTISEELTIDQIVEEDKDLVSKVANFLSTPKKSSDIEKERFDDPALPLNQNFVTFKQLNEHYNLLINRIQQQMSSIGGGGEVRLQFLDDVERETARVNGKYLRYDSSKGKWVGADAVAGGEGGAGSQGIQGIQGIQGTSGGAGIQGSVGLQGTTGGTGVQGFGGTQGLQGITGEAGLQGTDGTQGIQGIAGEVGVQGTSGVGGQGIQGTAGEIGAQGTYGEQGVQGFSGFQGITGGIGLQGFDGTQGLQGLLGDQGIQGTNGIQGIQGTQSPQGIQGLTGESGSSGYTLTGTTSNATETEILVNGSTRISVPTNKSINYTANIAARRTDTPGDYAFFEIKGIAANSGGTVTDVGSLYEVIVARTNVGYLVDARADDTNNTVNIYVTGVSGHTIDWKASVQTVEV